MNGVWTSCTAPAVGGILHLARGVLPAQKRPGIARRANVKPPTSTASATTIKTQSTVQSSRLELVHTRDHERHSLRGHGAGVHQHTLGTRPRLHMAVCLSGRVRHVCSVEKPQALWRHRRTAAGQTGRVWSQAKHGARGQSLPPAASTRHPTWHVYKRRHADTYKDGTSPSATPYYIRPV